VRAKTAALTVLAFIKLFSCQAKQDIVVVLAVQEPLSSAPAFFDKPQLLMEFDRGLIDIHARRIALLESPFQETIPEQDPNGICCIALSSVRSTDSNPKAKSAVFLAPAVQRYAPNVDAFLVFDGKYDDAIYVIAVGIFPHSLSLHFYRSGQFDTQLQQLSGRAVQRVDITLFGILCPQWAQSDLLALPKVV
jgi:hypothetical protein